MKVSKFRGQILMLGIVIMISIIINICFSFIVIDQQSQIQQLQEVQIKYEIIKNKNDPLVRNAFESVG